ncbi:MAG: hypothetical protein D6683_12935, partial [Actinomyces sp.]
MLRKGFAALLLGPSLLLASLAWSGFIALRTVFEPDRSRTVAEEVLADEGVRDQLASNVARGLDAVIPDAVPVTSTQLDQVARAVLADPRFTDLVLTAFVDSHRAFLGEGRAPETLDLAPLADTARSALASLDPALANAVPASEQLVIDLPTEHIPDASPLRRFLQAAVPTLAVLAGLGALAALLVTSDRPSVLRRAAFWALGTTVFYLAVGVGVPWVLRQAAPAQTEVLAVFLAALFASTVQPSLVLAGAGVVCLVVSWLWPSGEGRDRARREERPEPSPPPRPAARPRPAPRPSPPTRAVATP